MYLNMGENMVANGEHEKISIGRVLVSVSTPLTEKNKRTSNKKHEKKRNKGRKSPYLILFWLLALFFGGSLVVRARKDRRSARELGISFPPPM